jgi:hypothetical protein
VPPLAAAVDLIAVTLERSHSGHPDVVHQEYSTGACFSRSTNNMKQHDVEADFITAIVRTPLVAMGAMMPPRDPDEDEEDE